jgi:ATP phosphoribosyltransferase
MGNRVQAGALVLAVPETPKFAPSKICKAKACHRIGQLCEKISCQKPGKSPRGIFLGRNRSQTGILVDAIVEVDRNRKIAASNQLRIVEDVLSSTRFIANKDSWNDSWKREKWRMLRFSSGRSRCRRHGRIKMNLKEVCPGL